MINVTYLTRGLGDLVKKIPKSETQHYVVKDEGTDITFRIKPGQVIKRSRGRRSLVKSNIG